MRYLYRTLRMATHALRRNVMRSVLTTLGIIIGIAAVGCMYLLARRNVFSSAYYSPVDVTGLYWHFVDTVWIFLLPMLYLLGTHHL